MLIAQQSDNPLLRRSEPVKGLPAIGVGLVEAAPQISGFRCSNPLSNAGLYKLVSQRCYLLFGTIGALAFVPQLLAKRSDSCLYHSPDIRVRLRGMIRGRIMGWSPGADAPSWFATPGSGGGSSP